MKVRVRFNGNKNHFYVQRLRGVWPFRMWITATDGYSRPSPRRFETFEQANEYAVKMAVDYEYTHKSGKTPLL